MKPNPKLILLSSQNSARLEYVCHWIFKEQLGITYEIAATWPSDDDAVFIVPYCVPDQVVANAIPNAGLLFENHIKVPEFNEGIWQGLPCFFYYPDLKTEGPNFDIFSAVFYLISRYEEYLPYTPDKHQRYPATQSILFKMGVLERPLVDEWLHHWAHLLTQKGFDIKQNVFQLLPSYDIDIAYAYRGKGFIRTIGGILRHLFNGQVKEVVKRIKVLYSTNSLDPFDSFEQLIALHQTYPLKATMFMLMAQNTAAFDKNIAPQHALMRALCTRLHSVFDIGIHPSYQSNTTPELLQSERSTLEQIINSPILKTRQHYIKLQLPMTYERLLDAQLYQDYSMGYSTHLGFRAGTSHSFCWYHLTDEKATTLKVQPFCFMDATAHYELNYSAKEAFEHLEQLYQKLQSLGGTCSIIFHNYALGTAPEWQGWWAAYKAFVQQKVG